MDDRPKKPFYPSLVCWTSEFIGGGGVRVGAWGCGWGWVWVWVWGYAYRTTSDSKTDVLKLGRWLTESATWISLWDLKSLPLRKEKVLPAPPLHTINAYRLWGGALEVV